MKKILLVACAALLASSNSVIAPQALAKVAVPNKNAVKVAKPFTSNVNAKNVYFTQVFTLPQPIDNLAGTFPNEIKLFFSDIDGTLIPTDKSAPKGVVPQSVIEAYKELQNANIPLVLITGRSSSEAKIIANKIGIQNQFVIGQQGAEIRDAKNVLVHEDGIPSVDVKKIISDINSFNKKNKQSIIPFIYVKGMLYVFKDVDFPYTMDKPVKIRSISQIGKDFTAIKVGMYSPDINQLKAVQQYLAPKYDQFNIVISADCYCDISSKTATKGNALKLLANQFGVNLKNVATIGDNENDISMLKLLKENGGLAVVVENANDKTRENAGYVSSSVYQGGFLKAVQNVLKNNKLLGTKANVKVK